MEDLTSALIARSLDGLARRYDFTAQNIANANTPGYAPVRVSFEDSLRAAASGGADAVRRVDIQAAPLAPDGGEGALRLDLELASASQTAMRYRALIEILGRRMAIDRALAAAGGR